MSQILSVICCNSRCCCCIILQLITLKFRKIDTEMHYDVISVFDGPNKSAHNLGNFSGQTLPTDVTTTTGYLYVDFKSDLRTTKMGFSLTYTATDSCK